jgi:predicted dehydrogenase
MVGLFEDFYRAVEMRRAGRWYESSFATFDDGHQIVQLVEAVTASDASRGWVGLAELEELPV